MAASSRDVVRAHYDRSAHHVRPATTAGFRAACNAVKDVWLRQRLHSKLPRRWKVLDIGCGRGGDIAKCAHLAREFECSVDSYIGIDVAAEALQEAHDRLHTIDRGIRFDLFMCDAGCAPWDVPDRSQLLLLAHFSAHYWADTAARWEHFWSEATRVAQPGAILSLAVVDWMVVARCVRDGNTAHLRDDACVSIHVCNPDVFTKSLDDIDPHEVQIEVTLEGTLEKTPETCIHPQLLFNVPRRYGWNLPRHESMQSVMYSIGNNELPTKIEVPPLNKKEWNALNFYRMYAYVKT